MTIVAITGHRPEKILNQDWVHKTLAGVLQELEPEKLIQGMAAGVDLLSAVVAHECGIPFLSARPWAGHSPRVQDSNLYAWAIDNSAEVVNVDPAQHYAGPWVYQKRNEYMVDHATIVVAVWDGSSGGTKNCVMYAKRRKVPLVVINPETMTVTYPAGYGPNAKPVEPVEDEANFLF